MKRLILLLLITGLVFLQGSGMEEMSAVAADMLIESSPMTKDWPVIYIPLVENINNHICKNEENCKYKTGIFTCYTSRASECDSSPFVTASGARVRMGIVANNCLAFNEKILVKISEGNTKELVVKDRMNKRYGCSYWDVYWGHGEEAVESCLQFGRQELEYIIIN